MRGCDDLSVITSGFSGVPLIGDVRVFGPSASAVTNLEPEYVSFAQNRTTAFVTIQEANAVGTIDVATGQLTSVRSLGYKDYSLPANKLDPSDQDGGVNIANWNNLYGMYQPDAIASYKLPIESNTRFITANEGDSREWAYYSESKRVNQLTLDPTVFAYGEKTNAKLGRLTVTNTKGDIDNDGDFDQLYVYGGRSVSILDHNAALTWDSGDSLEQFIAASAPTTFNFECGAGAIDSRSDNKGPEPEGIAVGKFKNRHYAFTGLERQGGIVAYDLRATPGQAKRAGYVNNCLTNSAPEGISFIPAADSPTADALIMTASEGSGTLGIYAVRTP